MKSSEIKIKRRDVLSVQEVAALLRRMADQIETGHTLTLDGLQVILAHQLVVRQSYRKECGENQFELKLTWDDELPEHPNLAGDPEEAGEESGEHDRLPDPPPLDFPGEGEPARE